MMTRSKYFLPVAGVIVGIILGFGVASTDDADNIDAAVADALAAVTPEPTPEPTPIPTPLIVVEAPEECVMAVNLLLTYSLAPLDFVVDVFGAYVDFPDENLEQFGRRVETIIEEFEEPPSHTDQTELLRLANVCRDAS